MPALFSLGQKAALEAVQTNLEEGEGLYTPSLTTSTPSAPPTESGPFTTNWHYTLKPTPASGLTAGKREYGTPPDTSLPTSRVSGQKFGSATCSSPHNNEASPSLAPQLEPGNTNNIISNNFKQNTTHSFNNYPTSKTFKPHGCCFCTAPAPGATTNSACSPPVSPTSLLKTTMQPLLAAWPKCSTATHHPLPPLPQPTCHSGTEASDSHRPAYSQRQLTGRHGQMPYKFWADKPRNKQPPSSTSSKARNRRHPSEKLQRQPPNSSNMASTHPLGTNS